jgi:asparagine synthase (glutamine-hydrolysing)
MCAIVGALSSHPVQVDLVAAMRDRMSHRGPDHAGIWPSPDGLVCLGHRRLAIVDLTPEANQPFFSSDGRYGVVLNGEIYNFQSLRDQLLALGAAFRTRSDTEVLVEAYRYWGKECLDRFSGMFAFALWDTQSRTLFCARDRAGEKPFYYARIGNDFIFASELKALLFWPSFRKKLCYPALADFLSFGFVADPKTIWEGCCKLPPGHWMSVELTSSGQLLPHDPKPYWDFQFRPDHAVTDWAPAVLDRLQAASKEMAFADVPVGAFLSGGVDSSSVTAALSKAGCSVKTFTVGFDDEEYDERKWAREVAELYHTPHVEKVVSAEDVLAVFQQLLWHYDEPFNDYSYLPTYYLCREARKVITVALSGDGGDELFAGYRKYQRLAMRQKLQPYLPRPFNGLLNGCANLFFPETSAFRRKISQYTLDESAMLTDTLTVGLSARALRRTARGEFAEALQHYSLRDTVDPLLSKAPPKEVGVINSTRYLDLKLTLAGDILVKVDRASMAVALEVRPVYLHRDLIDLAERIPVGLLAKSGYSKEVLKSALRAWLPEKLLYRRKQGFAMPLKNWIGRDLRQFVVPARGGTHLDDLIDTKLLEESMEMHARGDADLTNVIHSLLFLKNWLAEWT